MGACLPDKAERPSSAADLDQQVIILPIVSMYAVTHAPAARAPKWTSSRALRYRR